MQDGTYITVDVVRTREARTLYRPNSNATAREARSSSDEVLGLLSAAPGPVPIARSKPEPAWFNAGMWYLGLK